jgi:O-acetyl-ADP-ribose deacetylase (regulator of RNase III)
VKYNEIKGNLLDLFDQGEFEIIAHGCNCQGMMGAGIASQIKQRYPLAYYADIFDKRMDSEKLGDFSTPDDIIFNLYTQLYPGPNARYDALSLCLYKLNNYLPKNSIIGLPQIGCGIGGLDFDKVRKIIQKELINFDVTIVIYDGS